MAKDMDNIIDWFSTIGWFSSVRPYLKKPLIATFLFGISSGFPLTIVFSLMSGWLDDSGVSKTDIGLFSLIGSMYLFKFLWAPIIDGVKLGALERMLGHRRSWLFSLILLIVVALLYMAQLDPATNLKSVAIMALILAILSASQDIVIDAYRIEIVSDEQLGHGAAMINFGYRFGNLIAGYFGYRLADTYGWNFSLSVMAFLALAGIAGAFLVGEPKHEEEKASVYDHGFAQFFKHSVVTPFKEFLTRDNAILILSFIMFLKVGDAMADLMMVPFQHEMGFSNTEIANYSKGVGITALLIGVALGPILYFKLGVYRALLISTLLMMFTNLIFVWAFYQGYDTFALAVSVSAEKFATGLGGTVVVAYLSVLCNRAFTATQYALLSALSGVGRTLLGSSGGYIVDNVGWVNFFVITTFAALPGLVLLIILWRRNLVTDADLKQTG